MWLLNVRDLVHDTTSDFALGLPKHDLGWPPLRPLFRDNINSSIISYFCSRALSKYLITKSFKVFSNLSVSTCVFTFVKICIFENDIEHTDVVRQVVQFGQNRGLD